MEGWGTCKDENDVGEEYECPDLGGDWENCYRVLQGKVLKRLDST